MARLVCLANSERPGGQCIAGIDVDTGQWIRPVPRDADALRISRCIIGGKLLEPLHIFQLELDRPKEIPRFQRENRLIKNWNWSIIGRHFKAELLDYCDETSPILHSASDRVSPADLEKLPPERWQSLQLVRARRLKCEHDPRNPIRWRAHFQDRDGNEYSLPITDGAIRGRLQCGDRFGGECLLTVSLTKPWLAPNSSQAEWCYKVVAAVIEL